MDLVASNVSPKKIWWRDIRRAWPIYLAGLLAMFITNGTEVLAPKTMQWIIDALVASRHEMISAGKDSVVTEPSYAKILKVCGIFVLVSAIGLIGRVMWRFTLARMTHVSSNLMKQSIWQAIRSSSLDHVSKYTLGDLMNRAIGDVNSARWIYGFTLVLTCDVVFFTAMGSIAMIAIHPGIASACLASFMVIPLIVLNLAKREYRAHELAQVELTTLSENVSQSVRGLRAQRASHSFYSWVDAMTESARRYSRLRINAQRISINSYPLCSVPTIIAYVVLFAWGPTLVARQEISVGEFAALASYVYLLQGPLGEIGSLVSEWQRGFASLNRIGEIRNLPIISDRILDEGESRSLTSLSPEQPLIDVANVSIARGGKVLFEEVTFKLYKGEWLGISGQVGSGKSSLLQGIAGLIPLNKGAIKISGRPVTSLRKRESLSTWTSDVVYAPEKPFVFAGSIRHNLSLNQLFSDTELWNALDVVCLSEEVRRMPTGLDNIIGEGGVSLSGGQRQRLALARIFLRASKIILLDDPLSAVDISTERQIIANLRGIWSQITVVLTSSKPATLECCERVATVTSKAFSISDSRAVTASIEEAAAYV